MFTKGVNDILRNSAVVALASNPRDGKIICTPVCSQLNLLLFSKMSNYVTGFVDKSPDSEM